MTIAGLTGELVAPALDPDKGDEFGPHAITAVETLAEARFSHRLIIDRFEVIFLGRRLAQFSRVQWFHALEAELVPAPVDTVTNTGCTNIVVSEGFATIGTLAVDIHLCRHSRVVAGYEVRA